MKAFIATLLIYTLFYADPVHSASLFSHRDCEYTVRVPGKMKPMKKQTPVGPVYGGMSALRIQGTNRRLTFQVECQKMPTRIFNLTNATDIMLNTLTQINMKLSASNTSYDVERTSFSVHGVSRGTINKLSAETIMRTESHLGGRSMLILRVIAHRNDVDKIIADCPSSYKLEQLAI